MAKSGGGSLRTYLLVRLVLVVPMVWILLTMVFLLMRVAPGDPVRAALGGRASQAVIAARRHQAGFDKSLIAQYGSYLRQVFTGHSAPRSATSGRWCRSSRPTARRRWS